MYFVIISGRRKKSFKKCPNERALINWARFHAKKPIRYGWQNERKIWSSYHLPLLVKKCHLLQHFLGNFLLQRGKNGIRMKKMGNRTKKTKSQASVFFFSFKTSQNFALYAFPKPESLFFLSLNKKEA